MYGVILVSYEGMGEMNMWVGSGSADRASFSNIEDAQKLKDEYKSRNPKGNYEVRELPSPKTLSSWERLKNEE